MSGHQVPKASLICDRFARPEISVVQQRVEHERVRAERAAAPERVEAEHDDVPIAERHVHERGRVSQRLAVVETAADQQVLHVGAEP